MYVPWLMLPPFVGAAGPYLSWKGHADGGARMHFFCDDAAGHALVEVKLRSGARKRLGETESVAPRVPGVRKNSVRPFSAQCNIATS